jgi:hypothetical protein
MELSEDQLKSLDKIAGKHFALQQKLNELVFTKGGELFEPVKDMSLDADDIQAIEMILFKHLEKSSEFDEYCKARKKHLPVMLSIMKKMEKAKKKDWEDFVETELSMHISRGVKLMANKMGISFGTKGYIQ